MTYSRLQIAYLTAVENAATAKADRELIVEVTNYKIILHDGATPGGRATLASEAFVQAQVAAISTGIFQNEFLFDNSE